MNWLVLLVWKVRTFQETQIRCHICLKNNVRTQKCYSTKLVLLSQILSLSGEGQVDISWMIRNILATPKPQHATDCPPTTNQSNFLNDDKET